MAADPRILVIDDDVEICSFLKDLLTGEGYNVFTASDPEKGLRMVEKLKPDLVMLDLKMPKMDGIKVLRRIKRMEEPTAVIVITGFGTMETARAAMQLGAFDYITKPFDLTHVKALVRDALAHRIGGFVEQLKSAKGLLSKKDAAFLDSMAKCRPEGPCVWEVAVRSFLLGDTEFMIDWAERSSIPDKDKKNLARLTQILSDIIRRARGKG